MLKIALAAVKQAPSIDDGLEKIKKVLIACGEQKVDIVCFPETYLPGLRGTDVVLPPPDQGAMEQALHTICQWCEAYRIAAIVGMEWLVQEGLQNRAFVVSADGEVLGYQSKNQITPGGEDKHYVADGERALFTIKGVPFGIAICHEGWRYPETVRWAATRGAQIVFQPQMTGSDKQGRTLKTWGTSFYEKAMECRAQENTIYFASVNFAMQYQNSATSLIDPKGRLIASVPYGNEDVLISEIDTSKATGTFARRFAPELYPQ